MKLSNDAKAGMNEYKFPIIAIEVIATVILIILVATSGLVSTYKLENEQKDEEVSYLVKAVINYDVEPKEIYVDEPDDSDMESYTYYLYAYDYAAKDGSTHEIWSSDGGKEISVYLRYDDPTDYSYPASFESVKERVITYIKVWAEFIFLLTGVTVLMCLSWVIYDRT